MPVYRISPNFLLILEEKRQAPAQTERINVFPPKILAKKTLEKLLVRKMQEYQQLAKLVLEFTKELDKKDQDIQKLKEELLSIDLPESYEKKEEQPKYFQKEEEPFSQKKVKSQFHILIQELATEWKKEKEMEILKENSQKFWLMYELISERKKLKNKQDEQVVGVEICSTHWFRPDKEKLEE